MKTSVPETRIHPLLAGPVRADGDYVLHWITAFRRTGWNFSLQRALDWCAHLDRPLLVLEALRVGHPFACDRFHRFVLDGMADSAGRFERAGVTCHSYVEPARGAGRGLLAALAAKACVVVADDFPAFFLPSALEAALPQIPVRFERVDSNGLLPVRLAGRAFPTARGFRSFLQQHLCEHLVLPAADPLARRRIPRDAHLPRGVAARWPATRPALLAAGDLSRWPIDHSVAPVAGLRGGEREAHSRCERFLDQKLARYDTDRNDPDSDGASGLSSYLHFGQLSSHEVFAGVVRREGWTADRMVRRGGSRGWWGTSASAEAFLDQLVTWRELGLNFCAVRDDWTEFGSLPTWARATLEAHAADPREAIYSLEQLESASTDDPLWNAAQRQLVREGRIQNYLRMLWGKKVLGWTRSPREALAVLLKLNDKYALDGRDPNSCSGIMWIFGRYDRPWGPERPVFGKIRFMTSKSACQKLRLKRYLERFGPVAD